MPNMNIRDVDPNLLMAVKVAAAREGITLKDYVLRAVSKSVKQSKAAGLLPQNSIKQIEQYASQR